MLIPFIFPRPFKNILLRQISNIRKSESWSPICLYPNPLIHFFLMNFKLSCGHLCISPLNTWAYPSFNLISLLLSTILCKWAVSHRVCLDINPLRVRLTCGCVNGLHRCCLFFFLISLKGTLKRHIAHD